VFGSISIGELSRHTGVNIETIRAHQNAAAAV